MDENNQVHSDQEQETTEFIELQPSLVLKFLKRNLPQNQQIQVSAQYRANFSKILSLFILYLNSMAQQEKLIKTKKNMSNYTEKELKAAFSKLGFEKFIETLVEQEKPTTQKKNEKGKQQEQEELQEELQQEQQEELQQEQQQEQEVIEVIQEEKN